MSDLPVCRRVLVIEDDPAVRRGLVDALAHAGYEAASAGNGRVGLELGLREELSLVLLDLTLPELDGLEVLAGLRRVRPALPIVVLTARGAEDDRIAGLERGADDYVVKPFSARELLARVQAVLRRSQHGAPTAACFTVAGRVFDLGRRVVELPAGGREELSEREVAILAYLANHRERTVSRGELLERVWGLDRRGLATRTVDMHVARLREKLVDPADRPEVILTLRGAGYRLADAP